MNKISRKNFRFSPETVKLLETKSKLNKMSQAQYIEYLLNKDIEKDSNDGRLVSYKLEEIFRSQKKLDEKMEEFGTLFIDFLQMFFRTQPDFPKEKEKFNSEMDNAKKKTVSFLNYHRMILKYGRKPFLKQIVCDTENIFKDSSDNTLESSSEADFTDNILSIENLKVRIRFLDTKVEELSLLFIDFLQMFFRTQPDFTDDFDLLTEELHFSQEKTEQFLMAHRNKKKKDANDFLKQIYGKDTNEGDNDEQ